MNNATMEKLIWVLIYGGLLILCLGLFVKRADVAFGWALVGTGALVTFFGALLVYLRSRRKP